MRMSSTFRTARQVRGLLSAVSASIIVSPPSKPRDPCAGSYTANGDGAQTREAMAEPYVGEWNNARSPRSASTPESLRGVVSRPEIVEDAA